MHNDHKNTKTNEDIYKKIFTSFSIKDFLTTNNPIKKELGITDVMYDKSTNSVGSKAEQYIITEKDKGKQRILVYDVNREGADYEKSFYTNQTYLTDKGDLFQFLKNRVQSNSKVFDLLEKFNFFDQLDIWKENIDVEYGYANKSSKNTKPFVLDDFKNLTSITDSAIQEREDPHYLNKRGISNDILMDPAFIDKVYVYDYTNDHGKTHENILFPKFKDGEIKGAEVKTSYSKGYCFGRDDLLWCSNKPEIVEKVVIVESGVNAISHKQLDPQSNQNTWYFSTNGNFYEARIDRLFEELAKEGVDKRKVLISLATDNDYDGLKYDLAFVNRLNDKEDKFQMDGYGSKPSISFETYDHTRRAEVHKFFIQVSQALNKTYRLARENSFITIESENRKLHLVFPNKEKIHRVSSAFSRSLIKNISFVNKNKIRTDKSKLGNDWNDELKNKLGLKVKIKPNEYKKKVNYKLKR